MKKNKYKNIWKYKNFETFEHLQNPQTLFHDFLTEQMVLNFMINDAERQQTATQYLTKDHFFFEENKQLFEFINEKRNKNINGVGVFNDYYDIINFIESEDLKLRYPKVNSSLVNEINSLFVNPDNFLEKLEQLIELTKMRNLETFYQTSLQALHTKKDLNFSDSIQDFSVFLEQNYSNALQNSSFISFKGATDEFDELITNGIANDISEGLKTGYEVLDNLIKGFKPGQLIILAARPGVGKTALALNIAKNLTQEEIVDQNGQILRPNSCAFISLEMPYVELTMRFYSSLASINLGKLQKPKLLEQNEIVLLRSVISRNKNTTNLHFDDNTSSKISDLVWKIKQLHKEIQTTNHNGLSLLIIDYLQLISGNEFSGNRQNEVAQISRALKLLALDLKIPILALSQLSRSVESRENKRPQLSDLRESGAIEQDADIVIFLSRSNTKQQSNNDETYSNYNTHIITDVSVAKNRNGPTGEGDLLYEGSKVTFYERKY